MTADINLQKSRLLNNCSCEGKGYIIGENGNARLCSCWEYRRRLSVLGERFVNSTLDNFIPATQAQRIAIKAINEHPNYSYMIYGQVRTGKTHILAALYNNAADVFPGKNEWYREADIKEMLRRRTLDEEESAIERLKEGIISGIYIDDLGKVERSGPYLQALYELIDEAYIRKARLCFTSVFSLEDLANMYGASIARRLEDLINDIIKL